MRFIQIATAAGVALLGVPASAFWRMECRGVSGQARIDPIMNPGEVGKHVHEIFGSGNFAETVTYSDLISADCTSCAVTADKSAYWTPVPYFYDNTTNEYEVVGNVGGMLPYYFLNSAPSGNTSISAFPQGFRMVAGDTNRRNYTVGNDTAEQPDPPKSEWAALGQTSQTDLAQRAIGFNCLDYTKDAEGSLYRHFMPSKEYIDAYCPDGIRFELMFPTCWDGVNIDSTDMSHVAYPDLVIEGDCDDDHPYRLPGLFYETIWNMAAYSDRSGYFVISNGDPTGYGYHGDFIMGWDETNFTLQNAVDTCTSLSGEIEDCPLFSIISEAEQNQCQFDLPAALAKEEVTGPLTALPGNVAVSWGPAPADADSDSGSDSGSGSGSGVTTTTTTTTQSIPDLSYSAGSTASVNGSVVPGNVFYGGSATTTSATTTVTGPPTLTTLGTSTYTTTASGGVVYISDIVMVEEIDYVTEVTTTTVWVEPTGGATKRRRDAHAHQHRRGHGHNH